jgi:hypothetical protein
MRLITEANSAVINVYSLGKLITAINAKIIDKYRNKFPTMPLHSSLGHRVLKMI